MRTQFYRPWMFVALIVLMGVFAIGSVVRSQSFETVQPDAALASAAPTSLLFSYQGQLLDTNGDPIPDPTVDMTFKLYDVEELGTACWTEDQTGADAVDVEDGLFNVLLGQITPLDTACLTGDVYLELVVEGEVMSPRELLTSVAFSALSDDVSAPLDVDGRITSSGVGGGDLMALNPNNQSASVALNWMNDVARIRIGGTGTGAVGGLDIQTQGDDSLLRILDNGNVGIGTVSPGEKLDVIGNIDLHDHELRNVEEIRSDNDYVGFFKVATSGAEGIRVGDIGIDSSYTNANTNLGSLGDNGLWVKGNAGVGGNVGIGTVNPSEKLHISGGQVLVEASRAKTLLNFNYEQGSTATTFYQHLATLDANNGMVQVEGTLGAHSKTEGKASVNLVFSLRGGVVAQGIVNGELIRSDIVLYEDSGVYRIYLKTDAWSQVNLRLTTNGSSALNSNPTTETSVPGALLYSAKSDAQLVLDYSGNVGIGTTSPSEKLDVNGTVKAPSMRIGSEGTISAKNHHGLGPDMVFETGDRFTLATADDAYFSISPASPGTTLSTSGWLYMNQTVLPDTNAAFDLGDSVRHWKTLYVDNVECGAISTGAIIESNLQTIEEKTAQSIDRFEEGDVLCWGIDQLELCPSANDRLVQAIADPQGRPIVIGAELVKVIGPVQRGDILVSSNSPGYAMVNNDPKPGTVIAQALEDFDGEQGVIKAMIRKW